VVKLKYRQNLKTYISFERTMLIVAEGFISSLMDTYDKHPISTYGGTWHPLQSCQFLKLTYHLHSPFEKSIIIERTIQYIKKELKGLMITFHEKKNKCKL
jgi:hypothetical protein